MISLKNTLNRNIEQYKNLLASTNGYSVNALGNDGYEINTTEGCVYSDTSNSNMLYGKSNSNTDNLNCLHKLQGITDAMMGYDDELSGKMDKDLDNLKRRQRNVQVIKDFNAAINIKNRVTVTVLRDSLLKQFDNGTYEPKKLKREKVKEVLLSFRRNLQQNVRSEGIESSLTTFEYI